MAWNNRENNLEILKILSLNLKKNMISPYC